METNEDNLDIRWHQRFSNFNKALKKLSEAVEYIYNELLDDLKANDFEAIGIESEIIIEGLIQRFEYTHELAWNVMKDFAHFQGSNNISGSRDATRWAFSVGLLSNGKTWMDMINSRNKTSHTYNKETAKDIYINIIENYFPEFCEFQKVMEEKRSGSQTNIF